MALETRLWREASIATDVGGFLARAGGSVLDALDATAVAVRGLDREHHHLDTVAAIRRGALGVGRPARPRTELTPAAAARVAAWIEAGEPERPGPRGATEIVRGAPAEGAARIVDLLARRRII